MSKNRKGVLILNLGTPDAADTPSVWRYLREFLSDPRVMDIPAIIRYFVLYLFILPFRSKRSAEAYKQIWTDRGSPLKFHSYDLARQVQDELGSSVVVDIAMRYQNPSIEKALANFRKAGIDSIVVVPMFPQYSSAAWGSAVEKVFKVASKEWTVPAIQVIPPFYDHEEFIDAIAEVAASHLSEHRWEKVLMSFHGLPERHCTKTDLSGQHCLKRDDCCASIVKQNRNCYRAQSFATAQALAKKLNLRADQWQIGFQSRMGRTPWIKPYTDHVIDELARSGAKYVAVLEPSFTADCLETLEEIQIRGRKQFKEAGGKDLWLIPTLNSSKPWVRAVANMVKPFL